MKMEFIITFAFLLSGISFVVGLIHVVKESHRKNKRLEVAKANGWVTEARFVDEKIINKANGEDYVRGRKELVFATVYEYTVNGKRKRVKVKSRTRAVKLKQVYYDPENNYRILNIDNGTNKNAILIIPIIVFVVTIIVLKSIFNV